MLPKGEDVVLFWQYIIIPEKKTSHNQKGTTLEPLGRLPETNVEPGRLPETNVEPDKGPVEEGRSLQDGTSEGTLE